MGGKKEEGGTLARAEFLSKYTGPFTLTVHMR